MEQMVIHLKGSYEQLDQYWKDRGITRIFLVCGKSFQKLRIKEYFAQLPEHNGINVVQFSEFTPNPVYEDMENVIQLFLDAKCDAVVAIGGGSALDIAKCIKLYATMPNDVNYLEQEIVPNDIPLIVMPTTAGTGSETTRYAVLYYQGEKQSINHLSIIPELVLMDASVLENLPMYQRKATMLDALCHAVEAFWSVNSTEESQQHSAKAIRMICDNMDGYLNNGSQENYNMLMAANYAGKAINITQTTAGHAMCYKLTSLYGISHGHAAALCDNQLWPYMLAHLDNCIDKRGKDYMMDMFDRLGKAIGGTNAVEGAQIFRKIVESLQLDIPSATDEEFQLLKISVNPVRLKNNPVGLTETGIEEMYRKMMK
ncbi:MAG: phosphonoacetaldehyde reductase [Peptococcaceae bacterium]|nr:phosphonoacetaldehyde reductase [Peptococcaceae bacterium]